MADYSGRYRTIKRQWTKRIATEGGTDCMRCGGWIEHGQPWDLGHDDATDEIRGPEHEVCNRSAGGRKGSTRKHAGHGPFRPDKSSTPALPTSSLSEDAEVDERLAWDPAYLRGFAWLADLADVPEDAAPPLMMTPVHEDAVCSYGWDGCQHGGGAGAWIEQTQRITLRWWQDLSLRRQLEHRDDGSLCFRKKIESAPRRAGKSIGMKGQALWRLEFGAALFGETQTIIHTGSDMAICREIQRQAWRWAESHQWVVTRGNGKEAIESGDGDRWLVRAQDAVYGYDVCVGMVDESWNVKPDTVTEGLEPATLERRSPQLVLTSTAHRRATSLMRSELTAAMTLDDPETLLLLWGARLGADSSDPDVWRAASPHWSDDRAKLVAAKYAKALAGEQDKEFDDPDPMKGFEAQYLNVWRVKEPKQVGRPVVGPEVWGAMVADAPDSPPDAIAVESWFDLGVAVARAWETDDGVVVTVTDCPDIPSAVGLVESFGAACVPRAGQSVAAHSAWEESGIDVEPISGSVRAVVAEFAQAIKEKRFSHHRSGELTEQALGLRVTDGVDGVRVVSKGRADAVKAATWAVREIAEGAYDVMDSIL